MIAAANMKEIFTRYVGKKIGLNFKEIGKFHAVVLVAVHDDYFSVRVSDGGPIAHYPFRQVLSFAESAQGIPISGFGLMQAPRVPLVVQTHVLKTGTIIGLVFPI